MGAEDPASKPILVSFLSGDRYIPWQENETKRNQSSICTQGDKRKKAKSAKGSH